MARCGRDAHGPSKSLEPFPCRKSDELSQIQRHSASSDFVAGAFRHWRSWTGSYAFADFLEAAGQSLWQVLPLGPTGYGDSPYACYSAFAGNTLLISPEQLVADGLLTEDAVSPAFRAARGERVDFEAVHKLQGLRFCGRPLRRLSEAPIRHSRSAFEEFCRQHVCLARRLRFVSRAERCARRRCLE